jgi:hypothetical protein
VRVDRQRVLDIRHAKAADCDRAIRHDPKRDAGHAVLLQLRFGERRERTESSIRRGLYEPLPVRVASSRDRPDRDARHERNDQQTGARHGLC